MRVEWVTCGNGTMWCSLDAVDLTNVNAGGVYIIWHSGSSRPNTVRVGQGDIRSRLVAHRTDPEVIGYRYHGALLVTWTTVANQHRDGVERFFRTR